MGVEMDPGPIDLDSLPNCTSCGVEQEEARQRELRQAKGAVQQSLSLRPEGYRYILLKCGQVEKLREMPRRLGDCDILCISWGTDWKGKMELDDCREAEHAVELMLALNVAGGGILIGKYDAIQPEPRVLHSGLILSDALGVIQWIEADGMDLWLEVDLLQTYGDTLLVVHCHRSSGCC